MSGWESLVSSSMFQAMAWALIHFLWQGAVVAVVLSLAVSVVDSLAVVVDAPVLVSSRPAPSSPDT